MVSTWKKAEAPLLGDVRRPMWMLPCNDRAMVFAGYNGGTDGVNFAAERREQVAGADAQVAYGHVDRVVSSTTVETHEK
jgi:hypothetical protein